MKKTIVMLLILALCLSLCACGAATPAPTESPMSETVTFTDSCGRAVEVPAEITRVAPSGPTATMFLAAAAPDYLVSVSEQPSEEQTAYLGKALSALPATGSLYGGKGDANLEAILSAAPQIIIDMGDLREGTAEGLDTLQTQTGIPCVFLAADLAHMAEAFRILGNLLSGKDERCEALASFVDETVTLAAETSAKIPENERVSVMYTSGADGLGTNARGSVQAQVLELVGAENAVVTEEVIQKSGGNIISIEQLYLFDPDVILFTSGSIYDTVAEDPAWTKLRAISGGKYYEVPDQPYNWLNLPPSMNMLLGIRWLGNLLYPAYYDFDMVAETQRAYRILWGYEMDLAEAEAMLANSTLK